MFRLRLSLVDKLTMRNRDVDGKSLRRSCAMRVDAGEQADDYCTEPRHEAERRGLYNT